MPANACVVPDDGVAGSSPNHANERLDVPLGGLESMRSDDDCEAPPAAVPQEDDDAAFGPKTSLQSHNSSLDSVTSSCSILRQAFSDVRGGDKDKARHSAGKKDGKSDDGEQNRYSQGDPDILQKKIKYLEQVMGVEGIGSSFVGRRKSRWHCLRSCCCRKAHGDSTTDHWVHSPNANAIFGSVIFLNAIFLGVESDLKPADYDLRARERGIWLPWFLAECFFNTVFMLELLLRIRAERCRTFKDPWNVFDTLLVTVGVVDTWVLEIVMQDMRSTAGELSFLTLLRVVRLVRLARVLRILRLIRFLRELLLLAQGILGAMRALGWSLVLILIVLYISAVFVTTLLADAPVSNALVQEEEALNIDLWFGSLGSSLLTLFQITTLEDWPEVVRGVLQRWPTFWVFFVPFIGLTNFVLVNVITGVVVERVLTCSDAHVTSAASQAALDHLSTMKALGNIFKSMDVDGLGKITEKQFNEAIARHDIMQKFYRLGFAKYEVHNLFTYLEVGDCLEINISELVEGCLRIHGPSQSKHLLRVQYDVLRNGKELRNQVMSLTRQVRWIIRRLQRVENKAQSRYATGTGHQSGSAARERSASQSSRNNSKEHADPRQSNAADAASLLLTGTAADNAGQPQTSSDRQATSMRSEHQRSSRSRPPNRNRSAERSPDKQQLREDSSPERASSRKLVTVDAPQVLELRPTHEPPETQPAPAQPPPPRSTAAVHLLSKLHALAQEQSVTRKLVSTYSAEVQELRTTLLEFRDNTDTRSIFSPANGSLAGDVTPSVSFGSGDEDEPASPRELKSPQSVASVASVASEGAAPATAAATADQAAVEKVLQLGELKSQLSGDEPARGEAIVANQREETEELRKREQAAEAPPEIS